MPRRVVLVALLAMLLAACVPATPGTDEWREDARHALGDVAGQLATVALALENDDRLVGGYAKVVVADAEESAGRSADGFEQQQPPAGHRKEFDKVSAALDKGLSLLTDARIAVVDGDTAAYDRLATRLYRLQARLQRLEDKLG